MRYVFMFLGLWLMGSELGAQVYKATPYSTEDGLPQSQVLAMLQDHKGFLWLGTRGGTSRFDGHQFENFTSQQVQGFAADFVITLFEDTQHNIWIGAERGLSKFDGQHFTGFSRADGLLPGGILCLAEDAQGRLWIGQEGGLLLYDGTDFSLIPTSAPFSVNALSFDPLTQHMWIGTNQGLYVCDASEASFSEKMPFLANTTIYCLQPSRDGRLWIGSDLGVYAYQDGAFTHYDQASGLPDNTIYTLTEDNSGQIWAGTEGGLAYLSQGSWTEIRPDNRNLPNVRSSLVDMEGNLWIGLDGAGIRKLTRGVFQTYNVESGLTSNIAKSFLEDEQGRIWISTYNDGINVYEGERFTHLGEDDGLAGKNISYSFKDSRGRLWFATYYHGLSCYQNGQFINYSTEQGLKSDSVYCVYEDRGGQLWIGTEHGISLFDGKRFRRSYTTRDGLIDNTVYAIQQDRNGDVWIGTPDGVSRFRGGTFTNFGEQEIGHTVIAILEDPDGRLWFATSEGLFLFQGEGFTKINISEAEGAHNVVSLVVEAERYLWVGTENGAYRLDLKVFDSVQRNRFEHYSQKDGLPSLECNGNAALVDSKGTLWIGTIEGAIMRPANTERVEKDVRPMLHITDVRLSLSPTDWDSLGYATDPRTGLPQNLRLPYSENRLDFSFIGLSLESPDQVEYRFKLEGLDENWSEETRQNRVSYTNLPPGGYTFLVESKKESSGWLGAPRASYTFEILYPWYQKWWFILLMSLLVAGIGYGTYYRISLDRRQKLEEQRIKNTAEKLQLEHQALYAMMNPHFTFNALQSIQYFIHRQDRISANKFLSSFAKLIRKNLESTKSEFISLSEEVERLRLYLSLENMRFPQKFEYELRVSEDIDPHDTQLPPMILQPFVENSIKHGIMPLDSAGRILVDVSRKDEDHLLIRIEDNGIGIETSKLRKQNRPSDHVSKGMQITMDRLALFARMTRKDYAVNISEISENGSIQGTRVELLLPFHQ